MVAAALLAAGTLTTHAQRCKHSGPTLGLTPLGTAFENSVFGLQVEAHFRNPVFG